MAEQREKEPVVQAAARRVASRWINSLGRVTLALLALGTVLAIHLVGLLIFTHGFLLTRLSIPAVSPAYNVTNPPPFAPAFDKAVIVIIDALRTDFISPAYPTPKSEFHHGVLTLPAELTASDPSHSLIFNSYSDPPTTTMQRIKGITTGSLPTFIDAGSNFASTAIEEDSLVQQLLAVNKSIAFMGDDTWMGLFPGKFKHAHPYDSFNVEDLHTVDNGVIEHIFPYLAAENATEWDLLIGHFLGVDHVGHRVGPDRLTMRDKLKQMDDVLRDVVQALDDRTLLVVLGDHGMNPKGDHGGDSDLETAAALWLYSKGAPLTGPAAADFAWPTYTFPGSSEAIRHVNQIDLVPTLALLLGIPIPFNNIGAPIPEPFSESLSTLAAASGAAAQQIERYVKAYGNRDVAAGLVRLRRSAADDSIEGAIKHNYAVCATALASLRALWAQFSVLHIVVGLTVLALGVLASVAMYLGVRNSGPRWDAYVRFALDTALTAGAGLGSVAGTVAGVYTRQPAIALQVFLVSMAVVQSVVLAAPLFAGNIRSLSWGLGKSVGPLALVLHCLSFASNSFIMWEDRMVLFLLVSILVVHMAQSFTAPVASQRLRILFFALVFASIARVLSLITVCREEQQPYCAVTFYSQGAGQPNWAMAFAFLSATLFFPRLIAAILDWSKSYAGPAPLFVAVFWRVIIIVNTMYWVLDFTETWDGLNPDRIPLAHALKQWAARLSLGAVLGALPYLWWGSGLCIRAEKEVDQSTGEEAVKVFGAGNAWGASYLLWLLVPFALLHLVSPTPGQMALIGMLTAILMQLELVDTQRDAAVMKRSFATGGKGMHTTFELSGAGEGLIVRPAFTDVVPLALLATLVFFATGHQAVLATIQWKAAFVGFDTVTYPWSPALVVLNTWGPFLLAALAVPLLAIWNISPRPNDTVPIVGHVLQVCLAFSTYFAAVALASATCAAWLRRHLMVWKVFAPRFMLAGITLLIVDIGLIVAVAVFGLTQQKVKRTFKSIAI